MNQADEQTIRERAYTLWQKEGSPEGRELEFWERSRLMLAEEATPPPETPLQQRAAHEHAEDQAIEASFPASDPPSFGSATPGGKATSKTVSSRDP